MSPKENHMTEEEKKIREKAIEDVLEIVKSYSAGAFTGWSGRTGESLISLDDAEDHFSECMLEMQDAIKGMK
jgi:hypothetical protein